VFRRWQREGVWVRILTALQAGADAAGASVMVCCSANRPAGWLPSREITPWAVRAAGRRPRCICLRAGAAGPRRTLLGLSVPICVGVGSPPRSRSRQTRPGTGGGAAAAAVQPPSAQPTTRAVTLRSAINRLKRHRAVATPRRQARCPLPGHSRGHRHQRMAPPTIEHALGGGL
jgi:hypothetical protein